MLINVEKMRMLRTDNPEVRYKLIKQNIERFFRDYIYYYNLYDRDELIIDSGYLPYHYLDEFTIEQLIKLFEDELGYGIIIMKTSNINQKGYKKNDLINIRLFDSKNVKAKEVDRYFNLKMFQPLYSTFHNFNNISGEQKEIESYTTCLNEKGSLLLNSKFELPI